MIQLAAGERHYLRRIGKRNTTKKVISSLETLKQGKHKKQNLTLKPTWSRLPYSATFASLVCTSMHAGLLQ